MARFWNSHVLGITNGVVLIIAVALALATNREDWLTRDEEG